MSEEIKDNVVEVVTENVTFQTSEEEYEQPNENEYAYERNELEVFKQCIINCANGKVGFFLDELKVRGDGNVMNRVELSSRTTDRPTNIIRMTEQYVYLNMEFEFEKDNEAIMLNGMFDQYIKKYNDYLMSYDPASEIHNVYVMTITLVAENEEEKVAYHIDFTNPIFSSMENGVLKLVFPIDNMKYGIEEVDYTGIQQEIEYEEAARREDAEKTEKRKAMERRLAGMDSGNGGDEDSEIDAEVEYEDEEATNAYNDFGDEDDDV